MDRPITPHLRMSALRLALLLACLLFLVGCSAQQWRDRIVVQGAVPGARAFAEIDFMGEKLGYLDARVATGGRDYRFLFPATSACRELLGGAGPVQYGTTGRAGFLSNGQVRCEPAGILDLREWRNRAGRRAGEGIKRVQANYDVYLRADGFALARGRFPLVSRLGIANGYRVIAILPDTEACADVLEASTASMEFHQSGKVPITLLAGGLPCEMVGVIFDQDRATLVAGEDL